MNFEMNGKTYETDTETLELLRSTIPAAKATADFSAVTAIMELGLMAGIIKDITPDNILHLDDYRPGVKAYTPEMGDRKPVTRMEASLGHYGKHYYIDTPEELCGRGIEYRKTYTANELSNTGQHKVGWHSYRVTSRAFEKLKSAYPIGYAMHLD